MAKISVYLHGQLVSELALMPGQEYFAGRGSQSHILLSSERGISRQHVKFFEQNGVWHAELLSKYGGLIIEGQNVETVELKDTTRFSVPPYDFVYEENRAAIDLTAPLHEIGVTPVDLVPAEKDEPVQTSASGAATPQPPAPTLDFTQGDRTVVAQPSRLVPYLKIINNKLKTEEVLKLEGSAWKVGRNADNEIVINDSAISRKHMEIIKKDAQFFVIDHSSSNGTHVNGAAIEPSNPHGLANGDVITVRHLEFVLELHDAVIENEKPLAVQFEDTGFELENSGALMLAEPQNVPAEGVVQKVQEVTPWNRDFWYGPQNLKKRIPLAIALVLILFVVKVAITPSKPAVGTHSAASQTPGLTVEQQKQVADFFNLAHNYYTQRKYTLCLSQLDRMKQLTPFYSNSKELENLCEQGQEDEARALDRQRREQEQEATQAKIQSNVDQCRGKLSPSITVDQMRKCLDAAIELDPENPMVKDLLQQADVREQQAKSHVQRAQEYAARKSEGKHLFDSAETAFRNGQQRRALEAFKKFIRGEYPGLNQDDDIATKRIAVIEHAIDQKVHASISACQSDMDNDNLKSALKECDAAVAAHPKDDRATDLRRRVNARLSNEMKQIYEDSVLEENMGNLDSAKDKWMQIVHHSVPGENYFEKARGKLRLYGVDL